MSTSSEDANKPLTLEEKMKLSLDGNQAVYAELLDEIKRIVRGYLYRKIPTEMDLEDVVQEVLISIHKARNTYDGQRPLKPWIMAIATYRLNDYLRKKYRTNAREVIDYDTIEGQLTDDDSVTERNIENESLYKALQMLPEKQRYIVKKMKMEGHSAKDIAKELDMSVSAVKVAAHRAYKKLKVMIEELDA